MPANQSTPRDLARDRAPACTPVRTPQIEPLMLEYGIQRITIIRRNGILPGITPGNLKRCGSAEAGSAKAGAGRDTDENKAGPDRETAQISAPPILLIEADDTIIDNPEIERKIMRIMDTPSQADRALFDDDHIACVLTWSGTEAYLEKIGRDDILG